MPICLCLQSRCRPSLWQWLYCSPGQPEPSRTSPYSHSKRSVLILCLLSAVCCLLCVCLLSAVCCVCMSAVCCVYVCCLLCVYVCCLLSAVCMSAVCCLLCVCLLSAVCVCLLSAVCCVCMSAVCCLLYVYVCCLLSAVCVCLLSAVCAMCTYTHSLTQVGLKTDRAEVRDLFEHRDLGIFETKFTGLISPSGVRLLLLTPTASQSSRRRPIVSVP